MSETPTQNDQGWYDRASTWASETAHEWGWGGDQQPPADPTVDPAAARAHAEAEHVARVTAADRDNLLTLLNAAYATAQSAVAASVAVEENTCAYLEQEFHTIAEEASAAGFRAPSESPAQHAFNTARDTALWAANLAREAATDPASNDLTPLLTSVNDAIYALHAI